jgi:hypothetical protein
LERGVRGKTQWHANKRRYKCHNVKKHKERYYVARDEKHDVVDDSSEDEEGEVDKIYASYLEDTTTTNVRGLLSYTSK